MDFRIIYAAESGHRLRLAFNGNSVIRFRFLAATEPQPQRANPFLRFRPCEREGQPRIDDLPSHQHLRANYLPRADPSVFFAS